MDIYLHQGLLFYRVALYLHIGSFRATLDLLESVTEKTYWKGGVDMTALKKHYSTQDVAKSLSVSDQTIRAWIRRHNIKAVKMPGSSLWRIPEDEIQKLYLYVNNQNQDMSV